MRMIVAAVVLAASWIMAGPADVRAESGNELFSHCSAAENNHWERGLCASNVGSVVETLSAMKLKGWELSPLVNFCPAAGIPEQKIIEVVTEWLRENPQQLHYDASILVMIALAENWPCEE